MAIKIRCVDCRKKISIDEAFAGGVCRCPYCTAIVYVPDDAGQKKKGRKGRTQSPARRPQAPASRPARPESPARVEIQSPADAMADTAMDAPPVDTTADTVVDVPAGADPLAETAIDAPTAGGKPAPAKTTSDARAAKAIAAARGQQNIPVAAPVKLQGIVAIVLMVLMVGMIGGMVYLAVEITSPKVIEDVPTDHGNTAFTTQEKFPAVAGVIKVTTPIVYCIDTSRPMANVFEPAGHIVIASIKSLKGGKFNIILIGEDDDKVMSPQPIASDAEGIKKAQAFITLTLCGFAEQARALNAALEMKAKTVVLLARDNADGAKEVAQGAFKEKGVILHTIILNSRSKGLEEMAKAAGGESRKFTASELADQAKRAIGQ